jgi:hypothetical protein
MIPATISTMSTTSPVTAPPKISVDNRKPPIGVSASTWPATAAVAGGDFDREPVVAAVAKLLHDAARLRAVFRHVGIVARQGSEHLPRHPPDAFGRRLHRTANIALSRGDDVDKGLMIQAERHRPPQLGVVERGSRKVAPGRYFRNRRNMLATLIPEAAASFGQEPARRATDRHRSNGGPAAAVLAEMEASRLMLIPLSEACLRACRNLVMSGRKLSGSFGWSFWRAASN